MIDKESKYIKSIDAWYDESVNDTLKKLYHLKNFDIVFVVYVFFSKALKCFPQHVLKLLETQDVYTDRHKMYLQNNDKYNWFSTTATQERKGLKRADIIVTIQDGEREFFSSLANKKTITIGHTVKIRKQKMDVNSRRNILFIGSANQSNIDAIQIFINDMFPKVRTAVPNATLLIAGPVCRVLNDSLENVVKLGETTDLDSVYEKADIVINPIRFGTGLKIKNIEALGYSKPLVTTSTGAEGMEAGKDSVFLVADDAQSFSDKIIKIFNEPNLYHNLSKSGYDFAMNWNRRQAAALNRILIYDRLK
jgi:glycosyltransferase involved in cell wall biosynthesis